MSRRWRHGAGFTLLPVVLAMSLIGAIAFLLNRDNGMNAEMVSRQADTDRARYAAEAGLQDVNAIIQQKNCSGPYPSILTPQTNANFGGATYFAYAIVPFGNVTSLISTGSYNGTSVTLTRSNVIAYQSTPNSYTMQPNGSNGIDSWIAPNSNKNYGADTSLQVKGDKTAALLKFDLSAFPAGSLPLGATLSVYASSVSTGTNTVGAYRLTGDWLEGAGTGSTVPGVNWTTRDGTAAWTAAGGDYQPVAAAYTTNVTANAWSSFDLTDLAAAWLLGRYPNYGVILEGDPNAGNLQFNSSDNANAATRPMLAITYLVPCGTTGPSGTPPPPVVTLVPIADAMLDQAQSTRNYGITTPLETWVKGGKEKRIAVQFDLSAIPAGTVIQSAILRYHVNSITSSSNGTKPITAYKLTESWVEGTGDAAANNPGTSWQYRNDKVNWTTSGGTYNATAIAMDTEESSGLSPPPSSFASGWLTWGLTALVQEWIDGVSANYGVLLVATTPSGKDDILFDSREAASNTPQLVISY